MDRYNHDIIFKNVYNKKVFENLAIYLKTNMYITAIGFFIHCQVVAINSIVNFLYKLNSRVQNQTNQFGPK